MKWLLIGVGVVVVLALGVALVSRGGGGDEDTAEKAVASLYDAIAREDYEAAVALHHENFIATTTRDELQADLRNINGKLGVRTGGKVIERDEQTGDTPWVDLRYQNEYANGTAVEFFRLKLVDGRYLIEAHNYQSDALR